MKLILLSPLLYWKLPCAAGSAATFSAWLWQGEDTQPFHFLPSSTLDFTVQEKWYRVIPGYILQQELWWLSYILKPPGAQDSSSVLTEQWWGVSAWKGSSYKQVFIGTEKVWGSRKWEPTNEHIWAGISANVLTMRTYFRVAFLRDVSRLSFVTVFLCVQLQLLNVLRYNCPWFL